MAYREFTRLGKREGRSHVLFEFPPDDVMRAEMIEVFKKIWIDDWGPRLEHVLRNALFTLCEMPGVLTLTEN